MTYAQAVATAAGFGFIGGFIVGLFFGIMTWATLAMEVIP